MAKKRGRRPRSPEAQKLDPVGRRRLAREERKRTAKPPRRRSKKTKSVKIPAYTDAQIRRICRTKIPDYDPWKNRGKCKFDVGAARHAIEFFPNQLKHVKGSKANQPFVLEPWQMAIIGNLFGWYRPDGTRRYRKCLVFVPRKNGKTASIAGIVLYVLSEDDEEGAEIYGAASEYKQACFVFQHARGMVIKNQDYFGSRFKIYNGLQDKAITYEDKLSTYQVLTSDGVSKHGGNTHLGVIDELHALKNGELVEVLETSTGARDSPLLLYLTTSDFDRPSVCNETHEYAKGVINGTIPDPYFLPVIYEASPEDDWSDPKVWAKVNPNLGISVKREYLDSAYLKAKENLAYQNTFKRLHLNIRTQQDELWITLDNWDASAGNVDRDELKGRPCYASLDLASTKDLNSLCLTFLFDDHYESLWWFWSPRKSAEVRAKRDKAPYLQWEAVPGFELTDGNETDYRHIRKRLNEIYEEYPYERIAIDRLFQGAQLAQDLQDDDMEVIAFGQGFASMAAPTAEFDRLVNRGEYHHGGNPIMRWMIGHAAVEKDAAGNMKPSKKKSTEKIDGVVTGVMNIGLAMADRDSGESVYDQPGRMTLQ